MKKLFLTTFYSIVSFWVTAQNDSSLSLHILDQKICVEKSKLNVSFSYYYENRTSKNLVVIDYYEPCVWEKQLAQKDDSLYVGLYLVIEDENGKVLIPQPYHDTLHTESNNLSEDGLAFYDSYNRGLTNEYHFNTAILQPGAMLTGFFSMRLNKRKCFQVGSFVFDSSKKYNVQLQYTAPQNIREYANKTMTKKNEEIFSGVILSNKVPLCWK
ncbi:MAG TPA: hypothetical protein DCR46_00755 [Cytophagales bacterium]|jgi:hypothetical protein|nr:hypothetical protein [Cytophagales bacterium]